MNTNETIPNLPFSIEEIDFGGVNVMYLGLTTTGTYIFFDAETGSVYRYNSNSGYLRRNSHYTFDGRNSLVTKHRIERDELLEVLEHYVPIYRRTIRKRRNNGRRFA